MNKPIALLPFIYVYRVVLLISRFFKYTSIGIFITITSFIKLILNSIIFIINYSIKGFVFVSYLIYSFLKNIIKGLKSTVKYFYIFLTKTLFQYVYDGIKFVLKTFYLGLILNIIKLSKYVLKGIVFSFNFLFKNIFIGSKVISLFIFKIFIRLSYFIYRFLKLVAYGFITPFVYVFRGFLVIGVYFKKLYHKWLILKEKQKANRLNKAKRKEEAKKLAFEKKEMARLEKIREKERKQEIATIKREERLAKKREHREKYRDERVKIEKKSLEERLSNFFKNLNYLPNIISNKFKKAIYNSIFAKNVRNKRELKKEALLIDFDGEDAEKSKTKIIYEYVAKDQNGKVIKGHFEAFSKVEVHSFLLSENYEVYSIRTNRWIAFIHGRNSVNTMKIKNKDLIFFLTQLSTYLKAGIPLVEALRILTRQYTKKSYQRIFRSMVYDLTMGESFSTALTKQGVAFPKLLINMVKTAEMTGQLPEVLDELAEYFTEIEKTRKQMITAMIYPSIVLILSLAATTFIMLFVVPKFVEIYESMDASQIPRFTLTVISVSGFLEKYLMWIILGFALFIVMLFYLYKNVKLLRIMMQWIAMHIPGFNNIIIYNEITTFTKTLASLLSHNIFITDSMEILNKITNNEIYKMLILDSISNVARGERISSAFENHWAFPLPAYEMIVTGETTGQLPEMMDKVSDYYQELHRNSVSRLKTLIEPVLIAFLTIIVGIIVLSIVIPMFNSFQMLQQ